MPCTWEIRIANPIVDGNSRAASDFFMVEGGSVGFQRLISHIGTIGILMSRPIVMGNLQSWHKWSSLLVTFAQRHRWRIPKSFTRESSDLLMQSGTLLQQWKLIFDKLNQSVNRLVWLVNNGSLVWPDRARNITTWTQRRNSDRIFSLNRKRRKAGELIVDYEPVPWSLPNGLSTNYAVHRLPCWRKRCTTSNRLWQKHLCFRPLKQWPVRNSRTWSRIVAQQTLWMQTGAG